MKLTEPLIDLFNRIISLLPDGDKKLQFKIEFAKLMAGLKQPLVLSILTVLFYLVFQVKSVFVANYLFSEMFYIDLTLVVVSVGWYFDIKPSKILDIIKNFLKKKKEK